MRDRQTGVLLINLGTPESPRVSDVRRYLREFLSDPRVLDMPRLARLALLELVILPFRPRRSARAYEQVWLPTGSPLLVHGLALCAALESELGPDTPVELAMRYGAPSLRSGLEALCRKGAERIVALPLFPQHSEASTGSATAKLREEHVRLAPTPTGSQTSLDILPSFYDDAGFIEAMRSVAHPRLTAFRPDSVLMSFHGLPESHLRKGDASGGFCLRRDSCCDNIVPANRHCYRAQCAATARCLARALSLAAEDYSIAFQSRLGRTPWIRPYTDERLAELASSGVKRLAILCPAFVADCLETLEEIGVRARESWLELGGEDFLLVPSLNAEPVWVTALATMLRSATSPG